MSYCWEGAKYAKYRQYILQQNRDVFDDGNANNSKLAQAHMSVQAGEETNIMFRGG